jgi:ribosomal protein S1
LVWFLVIALLGVETIPVFAKAPQSDMDAATVKGLVQQFGVGKSVKMTLKDGQQVSGHIKSVGADSFTVKVGKASERTIPYSQVTFIKDPGAVTWMLIGAAIVIAIIIIVKH